MKLGILAGALAVGLSGPAAANVVLDFTTAGIGTGNLSGSAAGSTYTISGFPGALTDSTHSNNVGCSGQGWDFACAPVGDRFDVGFGVQGGNNNEVDGAISVNEFVKVTFSGAGVILNGFAGMLTFKDSQSAGTEWVILQAFFDNVLVGTFNALPIFDDNDPSNIGDNNFGTVGLAFLDGLSIKVNEVRFLAGGVSPFDDGNSNITAAGLKISPVPLPAGVLLLGLGLGGLAAYRRRQVA